MPTPTASASFPLPGLLPASAGGAGEQDWIEPLIDRVICTEQEFLAALRRHRPVVETYLQESREGGAGRQPAGRDHYMIGRLSLGRGIEFESFLLSDGFRPGKGCPHSPVRQRSRLRFGQRRRQVLLPHGFARMVAPDVCDFSRERLPIRLRAP